MLFFFDKCEDWHKKTHAAQVIDEYNKLIIRLNKGHRSIIARCKRCDISFITSVRNKKREDLCCPFGCREKNSKKKNRERSKKYNATDNGKAKKKEINKKRSKNNKFRNIDPNNTAKNSLDYDTNKNIHPDVSRQPASMNEEVVETNTIDTINNNNSHIHNKEINSDEHCAEMLVDENKGAPPGEAISHSQSDSGAECNNQAKVPAIVNYIRIVIKLISGCYFSAKEIWEKIFKILRQRGIDKWGYPAYKYSQENKPP